MAPSLCLEGKVLSLRRHADDLSCAEDGSLLFGGEQFIAKDGCVAETAAEQRVQ